MANNLSQINHEFINDEQVRVEITRKSMLYFSTIYFAEYFSYDFAEFHYQMFKTVEDTLPSTSTVITFRGSGKSTILTLAAPLWLIMGAQQRKFVVIVCQTQEQAKAHLGNIKSELENNPLLRQDMGPYQQQKDEWNAYSLEFSKYSAKIIAVSLEQRIRGLRYKQHRPDVIICDDLEDSSSVQTSEGRKKIKDLYSSEIAPLGDQQTKIILVGNFLHTDSLLATLQEKIRLSKKGVALFVPLIDEKGSIAWPQKFPTAESIAELRERILDYRVWMREYLLKIISDEEQLLTSEDIKYYDELPASQKARFIFSAAGVDLAISKEVTADYTAIVSADVYQFDDGYHVFIHPYPLNRRMSFRETVDYTQQLDRSFPNTHFFIESVAYQSALVEQLQALKIPAHEVKLKNLGKRERLALVVPWITRGKVEFPFGKCDQLINQMLNFGVEPHDDLVDALSLLIMQIEEYARSGKLPVASYRQAPQSMKITAGSMYRGVSCEDSGSSGRMTSIMAGVRAASSTARWGR